MDYLDPKKRRRHAIIMMVGYVLIGIAILGTATVLLYQAYGFGVDKNGQVIQNGLLFVSSQPRGAAIYLNGQKNKLQTNTRLSLPAGRYTLQLQRPGYKNWQRSVAVEGGDVQHFDYPLLIPQFLTTTPLKPYASAPGLATQSPDQRWLIVQQADATTFDMYDLKNPAKAPESLVLPTNILSKTTGDQELQTIEWANDNQHVLLQHSYDNKTEFIVLDRTNPDFSVNLNTLFSVQPTAVSLNNKKYDEFYLYDADQHTLQTASLRSPTTTAYLDHVLAYKSYSDDTMLYATDAGAPSGQTSIKLQVGTKRYDIKNVATGTYVLDVAGYKGSVYVVAGSSTEGKVYIYKDPVGQLNAQPKHVAVPKRVLRVANTNFVGFSSNTQFVLAENGAAVGTYDIQNDKSYAYTLAAPVDAPASHAFWMDGNRLAYASQGKLVIIDYDNTNQQLLMPLDAHYKPFFAPDMKHVFGLTPAVSPAYNLTQTALRTPADL